MGMAANQQHSGIIGADHLTPSQAARVTAAIVPLPLVDIVEAHRVALYGCGCGTVLTAGIGVGARDIY